MTSLCRIIEQIEQEKEDQLALESYENFKAGVVIRTGMHLRDDFWDDFIKICNQSQALSELLGVRKEVIARWPSAIREALAKVQQQDSAEQSRKKATLITTGY